MATRISIGEELALTLRKTSWWLRCTDREIVELQLQIVEICLPEKRFKEAIENCLGRTISRRDFENLDELCRFENLDEICRKELKGFKRLTKPAKLIDEIQQKLQDVSMALEHVSIGPEALRASGKLSVGTIEHDDMVALWESFKRQPTESFSQITLTHIIRNVMKNYPAEMKLARDCVYAKEPS